MTQKPFLHIGCGPKRKDRTTRGFNSSDCKEIRFDIDPNLNPDITGTMLDMSAVEDGSMDAVFSSHNIEHLYPHEVLVNLTQFIRVLKPDGFLVVTCPDLQSVCALIAENKLTDPVYTSPARPVVPLDILHGFRPSLAAGNLFMDHKCGFTKKVLTGTLKANGFASITSIRTKVDLWALGTRQAVDEATLRARASKHFPV